VGPATTAGCRQLRKSHQRATPAGLQQVWSPAHEAACLAIAQQSLCVQASAQACVRCPLVPNTPARPHPPQPPACSRDMDRPAAAGQLQGSCCGGAAPDAAPPACQQPARRPVQGWSVLRYVQWWRPAVRGALQTSLAAPWTHACMQASTQSVQLVVSCQARVFPFTQLWSRQAWLCVLSPNSVAVCTVLAVGFGDGR
jgi:hypothetical protein